MIDKNQIISYPILFFNNIKNKKGVFMKKKHIACLGNGKVARGNILRKMQVVGKLLAENNCTIFTGTIAGSEIKLDGDETWDYTLFGKPANPFIDETIDSSKITIEGCSVEERYGFRLASLLQADGFIIADTGGIGTLTELCAIVNLEEKIWKNKKFIAILVSEYGNLKIMEQIIDKFVSNKSYIMAFHDPAKAVGWVTA